MISAKDPNKPKRAMSAFFLYSQANRTAVKESNPDASFGDVVSKKKQDSIASGRFSFVLVVYCCLCVVCSVFEFFQYCGHVHVMVRISSHECAACEP